uniref:PHD finger protein At2g01810-like n=1 Tax=Erigeron canadensis TaxID=72917 RepID=UPI001CB91181|nr:PHD finger protein At2g01810-like [Erigeron canadensis]
MARCIPSSYRIIDPDTRFIFTVNARPGDDDHIDKIMLIDDSSSALKKIQPNEYIESVLYDDGPDYRFLPVEFTTNNNGSIVTAKLFDIENDEIAIKIASLVMDDYEECLRSNCGLLDEDQIMEESDQEEERAFCVICQGNCGQDEMTATLECNHFFHMDCIYEWLWQKDRKQRIFEFNSFSKALSDYLGPFRDNVRLFLDEFGEKIDDEKRNVWSTLLLCESNGVVFPLYTIEEHVNDRSVLPFCFHCKSVGWGHHFVSKRRYRFIIPSYGDKKPWKDYDPKKDSEHIDTQMILHGLIHCNGFGHLISVNNLKLPGSSNSLTETHIMNLWDSICTSLKTRKVSVADVKLERSMELRLINGVAYKSSWFGNWGYKFGNGSFGVTEDKYRGAVLFLAELDLDKVIDDFKNTRRGRKLGEMVNKYRELSETRLTSMSELLQFLIEFKLIGKIERRSLVQARKLFKCEDSPFDEGSQDPECLKDFLSSLMDADCNWSERRIEHSLEVIVKLLKQKNGVMSICELRESLRPFVGDKGLIDFVLNSINVLHLEKYIIRRVFNSLTGLAEFEISDVAVVSKKTKSVSSLWRLEPRWPKERLERTAKVIANILKEHKNFNNGRSGPMSRKDLRNIASKYVGDTGLIDFVLKSINNLVIGNYIVTRTKNPQTRLMEFNIRDKKGEELGIEKEVDVYGDMLFLYTNVLLGYPLWKSVSQATQIVLNSKYFVKEWELGVGNGQVMTLRCRVLPSFDELETELTHPLPPGEIVLVAAGMTIGKLREVAESALRDTYCIMDRFVVWQIGGLKGIEDEMVVSYVVEPGGEVWVRGFGLDLGTALRYEGGTAGDEEMEARVECVCGARDDDGERMVACDECHVWKHTKCSGIKDHETAPEIFICSDCEAKAKSELLSQ